MTTQTFNPGEYVYYFDNDRSGWPGQVLAVKRRVKVCINHYDGDKTIWVKPEKLEHQCANG